MRVRVFLDTINGTDARPVPGSTHSADAPSDAPAGTDGNEAARSGVPHSRPAVGPGLGGAAALAANVMLTVPLTTLLGPADQPGEAVPAGIVVT